MIPELCKWCAPAILILKERRVQRNMPRSWPDAFTCFKNVTLQGLLSPQQRIHFQELSEMGVWCGLGATPRVLGNYSQLHVQGIKPTPVQGKLILQPFTFSSQPYFSFLSPGPFSLVKVMAKGFDSLLGWRGCTPRHAVSSLEDMVLVLMLGSMGPL